MAISVDLIQGTGSYGDTYNSDDIRCAIKQGMESV